MNRTRPPLSLLILLGLVFFAVPASAASSSLSRDTLGSFLQDHLPDLHGTVVAERSGQYHVRFEGPSTSGPVRVYRNTVQSTDQGQRLVERDLGTGIVTVKAEGIKTIRMKNPDTVTLQPGDRFRARNHRLTVYNRSEVSNETLRQWLNDHRRIDSVQFVEDSPGPDQLALLLSNTRLELQVSSQNPTRTSIRLEQGTDPTPSNADRTTRETLLDRATFDRRIHDFEWVELPTRGSIRILMLATEDAIGFARYEEGLGTIHWMDVSGTVLDVSFVTASTENPGELFVLAVLQDNDEVHTRAFTFNALDRSVQTHWTEPDVFIRRVGSNQFVLQKIGLNSPFKGEITHVTITRDHWSRDGSVSDPPQATIPRGYTASDSGFAYLDRNGRLTVREDGTTFAKGVAEYGDVPESISALRNDRSLNLHPSFPLRSHNRGYRTLIPDNIASGLTFFQGLKTLRESRVYHLAVRDGSVETLWESNRLSGYVSGTDWYNGGYWIMLVNPDAETSTLKFFEPTPVDR